MTSADKGLEDRLRKIGDSLRSPPTSVDELLPLLDRTERLLLKVEQSPSQSMINAIRPAMNALVAEELLRHPNVDVRVSVASCTSEITRITAPDAPYDDDLMKVVFQRIVDAFEKLDDMSSSLYSKRVSILETVAKVRSCVVMLDLECDDQILHMFRHFLNTIRLNHPENVFSSMETIMTLVVEESEDISPELVSCLLESLKKDSKELNPTAFRLAEKVVSNCGVKLNPALIKLVQNTPLSNYSKVVGSLRQENSDATDRTDVNDSGKNVADDSKLSERAVSDELPQASPQLDQVGCPQESDTLANESSQSKMANGTVPVGNGESVVEPTSPKQKPEQSRRGVQSKRTVPETTDDSNNVESVVAKPDTLSDLNAKKMGGHSCNLSTQLTETSDGSRTDSEKETPLVPGSREDHGREADSAQVDGPSDKEAESPVPLDTDNKDHLQLPASANDGTVDSDPPKGDGSSGSDISDKKGGGDLSPDQLMSSSKGPDSEKAVEDLSDSEEKPLKHSGKKGSKKVGEILAGSAVYSEPKTQTRRAKSANDGTVDSDPPKGDGSSGSDISDKKGGGDLSPDQLMSSSKGPDSEKASEDLSDSEEKPLKHSGKKGSKKVGEILAGSAVYSEPKTRTRRAKSANDGTVDSDPPKGDGSSGSDISDKKGGGDLSPDQLMSSSKGPDSEKASEDLSDSEEKPLKHSGKKGSKKVGEILAGSAVYSEPKTRTRRAKMGSTVKDGVTESSRKQPESDNKQLKEITESEDAAGELSLQNVVSGSLRNRSGSKRKNGWGTEKISASKQIKDLDESLVGSLIKVWWPDDKAFYDGEVHSYDPYSKKHKIVYNDGDVEILLLEEERWEFIEDKTGSSHMPKKAKIETPSSNEFSSMRTGVLPKRKCRSKAASEDKEETPKSDERSKDDTPRRTPKSKDDSSNHRAKSNDDVSRTRSRSKGLILQSGGKSQDETLKRANKSKDDAAKGKGSLNGSSARGKLQAQKRATTEKLESRGSGASTGKKRRRKSLS